MRTQGDRLMIGDREITLKGSNFYPLENAYAAMWQNWNSDLVREGLNQAARLGNNAVRIMIPFPSMHGWTHPADGSVYPQYLDRLRQFLQLAADYNLRAIVTLFDFENFAGPGTREELFHRRYAKDIVTAFREDDRILAWDLHNEPDNYWPWRGEDEPEPALTWLYRMREHVRSLDPNHLITIGMGRRESFYRRSALGHTALDLSDFVAHHSYNADALGEELYELQERTGRSKPIILEEMGWPTGPVFATDYNEEIQASKYRQTLKIARQHNVAGVFQWMLYDSEPRGIPPWEDHAEYYGLIRRNSTFKPAAEVWRNDYTGSSLPPAGTTTNLAYTKEPPRENRPHYFPETDHYIGSPMWELWRRINGAETIGLPLTDAFLLEDIGGGRHDFYNDYDKNPIYQYFQKGRFELHRERRADPRFPILAGLDRYAFLIDLGNCGKEIAAARGYTFAPVRRLKDDSETYLYFQATSHALQEPFLSFWRNNYGRLAFGNPISEPFQETNPETGQTRTVQYFEKSRLEIRPESTPARPLVEAGHVGAELMKNGGWIPRAYPGSAPPPAPAQESAPSPATPVSTDNRGFADAAFATLWQRTDALVAGGQAGRTWLWGDKPRYAFREIYQESGDGRRLVQYFDKSRMEINNPQGDFNSKWYVTNGLLVREMISGQVQTGQNSFESLAPARIPLAGDPLPANAISPTYASLQGRLAPEADRTGQPVTQRLQADASLTELPAALAGRTRLGKYIPETGHNIAAVFWDFFNNSRGPVLEQGRTVTGDVVDWIFTVGLPVSEPYWVRARVAGIEQDVLVQAFERRVLTYTPANRPEFQVEMGNVGLHYLAWRYPGR